jgi:hypothetical protein
LDATYSRGAVARPRWRRLRSNWGFTLLSFSVLLGAAAPTCTPTASSPLAWTRSYYVGNPSSSEMNRLGCYNADASGRMTLFFGAPVDVNGNFGATLWGGENRTVEQIGELMKDFVRGYVWCRTGGQQILVGMGTSNSAIDNKPDPWLVGHGSTWAHVVSSVADWAAATYPGAAQVYGAWDIEPSWSAFAKADLWMQGYASLPGNRSVHANFSADGCPRDSSDGGACNNGWNQALVYRLAWQWDPSLPMPQIYANSGVNARQWQKIDEYGARHANDGMVFSGVMTQWAACQSQGGCAGTGNMPHEGHDQMLSNLNSNPLTSQPHLEAVTDMNWHS